MIDYLEKAQAWFEAIRTSAESQTSPHRRAILRNFLEHAALEYTSDRWHEILEPDRTAPHPLYHIRMGTPDIQVFDGREAVRGFYSGLKEGTLTNEHINLAVDDWGFASFFKIHQFMSGQVLLRRGINLQNPDAFYHMEMPLCAMYWLYDDKARLLGEYVYSIQPAVYEQIDPALAPTHQQVQDIVQRYLPEQKRYEAA